MSFQVQFDFQGKTMIFVGPIKEYSAVYLIVAHFEANWYIITAENM